jgi:hypothetical protein
MLLMPIRRNLYIYAMRILILSLLPIQYSESHAFGRAPDMSRRFDHSCGKPTMLSMVVAFESLDMIGRKVRKALK